MIQRKAILGITYLLSIGVPTASLLLPIHKSAIAQDTLPASPTVQTPPPDSGVSVPQPSILLEPGSRGNEVTVLQRQLQMLGYYDGFIDGIYGVATQAGVKNFQEAVNLPPTGSLDRRTWEQMRTPQLFNRPPSDAPSPRPTPSSESLSDSSVSAEAEGSTPVTPALGRAEEAAEPANSSAAEGDPEDLLIQSESAASTPQSSLWPFLALLGFALAAGGIGVALLLWQRLRHIEGEQANAQFSSKPSSLTKGSASIMAHEKRLTAEAANGIASNSPEETTRLARVNIFDELIEDLRSPDPDRRRKAIWELGQRGNSSAAKPLVDTLLDADSKERSLILAALSEVGMRTLKPVNRALAVSLQDPNPEVRKNAIRDLTRVYDLVNQISQMLAHASQDSNSEVQDTARWALEQLGRMPLLSGTASSATLISSGQAPELLQGDSPPPSSP